MKRFVDTSVIVYAFDKADAGKRRTSLNLLRELGDSHQGVVSAQVLLETFNVLTRRLKLAAAPARSVVELLGQLEVVSMSPELAREAIDCSVLNQLSIWDAAVVVAAAQANCGELLTEDLNAGQRLRGVKVVNPYV